MARLRSIADRVWTVRLDWYDVNVTVVGGTRGLLVVDAHGSLPAGRTLAQGLVEELDQEPVALALTHWHFDHTFGAPAFVERWPGLAVLAHEDAAQELADGAARIRAELAASEDPRDREAARTEPALPTDTFASVRVVDLGDRSVELLHPGPAHTGGDLVVRVPDADVLVLGDLVEESGPPSYGPDSHPLAWPLALDFVLGLMTEQTVVVPGHGSTVDRSFVLDQRGLLGGVAETIRDLASRGVPRDQAVAAAEWPLPTDVVASAVERGYEQLPQVRRQLPLV